MLDNFAALPALFHISVATILGLLVGSFLNVVIYRYPKILHFQWTEQSRDWLEQEGILSPQDSAQKSAATTPPGIIYPPSHCGNCKTPVKAWQNIPVISYVLLGGKCASCKTPISLRYPLVELLTAVLSGLVIYKLGFTLTGALGVFLTWVLVALAFIDFDHQILPDDIVLPVMWLGLGLSLVPVFATTTDALIGTIAGYLSLWLVFHAFRILTGKHGMGHGDFKLLALFGAWLGWQYLPQIILLSTVLGSIVGISLIVTKKISQENTIPFGPYIAAAGWLAMLYGPQINAAYLKFSGL